MARLLAFILVSAHLITFANPVPNYPLVNQKGKPFQFHDLKGQYIVLSFIFTRCPLSKMCPLTVSLNKRVHSALKKDKSAPKTHFLFVTLDPDHDSSKILEGFATARGLNPKDFTLATGNSNSLSDFASQFNVIGFPTADGSLISHNLKTILLDPNLNVVKEFKDNEWTVKDLIQVLKKNFGESGKAVKSLATPKEHST